MSILTLGDLFATRYAPPADDDGAPRVDPLARLFDEAFTETTWYYEGSKVGDLPGKLHPKQVEALSHPSKHRWLFWGNQVGKGLAMGTPVLTPSGWRAVESLRVGDAVIAGDGTATAVTGVYPQGVRPLYRFTFDDGANVVVDDQHRWKVRTPGARFKRPGEARGDGYTRVAAGYGAWSVLDTTTLRGRWGDHPKPGARCSIPVAPPARLARAGIPLDPYLLGVLLGDGSMTSGSVTLSSADADLVTAVGIALPPGIRVGYIGGYDYQLTAERGQPNALIAGLRALGVYGHGAATKFVPREYLDNAPDVRLAVLQGLLDTDGTVGKKGAVEFCSISAQLADDVIALARSLGGKAHRTTRQTFYTHKGERRAGQPSYRVRIRLPRTQLFRLDRKQARCFDPVSTCDERVLQSIEPAGEGESVCIAVAHPDQTYVTKDYIVTHNTSLGAVDMALSALGRHPRQLAGLERMPPFTGWASALTWELWEKILLPELLSWIPTDRILDAPPAHAHSTKRDIVILADNGQTSRITGKAAEQGAERYQSARLDKVWLDEEHPESVWDEIQPRLLRFGGRSLATMTPLKGLTWVHGRVYEPIKIGRIPPERHWYSHAGLKDNPSITPEARAELLEELKHNPAQLAARDEGLFVRPFGAVLPWDENKHLVDVTPERMVIHRVRGAWYGALDLGKWRFAFQFGVADTEGHFLLVDELLSQNEDADVRAKKMHDLLRAWRVPDSISITGDCADPVGIRELNEAFDRINSPYRVNAIEGELKKKQAGIDRLESMLNRGAFHVRRGMGADHTWYLGRNASKPGKPVMGSRWLWEIANWQYPKTAEGKIQKDEPDDTTADGADMMDGARYIVMKFFPADAPAKPKAYPTLLERIQKEMDDMDRDAEQDEAGGDRYGGILRQ